MPAFQPLAETGQKRKSDDSDFLSSRKKPAAGSLRMMGSSGEQYWMVQWRHPQTRKHKTWDGDAVLVLNGAAISTLYDQEGKRIGEGKLECHGTLVEGAECKLSGREMEIDCAISRADYLSGACFGRGASTTPTTKSSAFSRQFVQPKIKPTTLSSSMPARKGILLEPVDLISTTGHRPDKNNIAKAKPESTYWTAVWRKPTSAKHKKWDSDGFVLHTGEKLKLVSAFGKIMGSTTWNGLRLHSSYATRIGGREVELDSQIKASEMPDITGIVEEHDVDDKIAYDPPSQAGPSFLPQTLKNDPQSEISSTPKFVAPTSFYGQTAPKPKLKGPLHDAAATDAVVMKSPTKDHAKKFNKKDLPIVPVVLDPVVARHLRAHQREGVKFLYECVMGLRKHEGQGCILADEMGLGKTLQTICLVWTLLKQNPYAGGGPVIGKVLVVCPVTLVNNWKAEFHKWLSRDRVGVFIGDKDKSVIKQFINSRIHQVLVIGYEKLRTVIDDLAYCQPPIGLVICDEGHRLKSANNKTTAMFKALRTPRRIILSGTPIQNDLSEFHAMADFCNPGLLDDYSTFRRVYEIPILKSRAPGCTSKETEIGEARSSQLLTISKSFVLRRDATILKNYLPPKHEYVVFVTPTALQLSIFSTILNADKLDNLMQSSTAESLALINTLTKISNSPILLKATADKAKANSGSDAIKRAGMDEALKLLPPKAQIEDFSLSGKLAALSNLLKAIRHNTEEKCVIVSHYTSTLNIIEAFCKKKSYTYFRLDGQTPTAKRQEYVNTFNKSSQYSRFLFLLSSKAGGVGLNITGASRLCLIDSDWNPSHDLQSMARIHRDGQKRPVFIYRFLTAGTIDEKIYQRQVTKLGLSNSLMGSGTSESKSDSFSRKDLRDIFRIDPDTACNTHDLLECPCNGMSKSNPLESIDINRAQLDDDAEDSDDPEPEKGFIAAAQVKSEDINKMDKSYFKKKKAELAALGEWTHIDCLRPNARDDVHDDILRKLIFEPETDGSAEIKPPPPQSKSRIDSLLSAIDWENISAVDEDSPRLGVHDVPGGTISFLFEKSSKSAIVAEEDEEDHR
ncbi:hypothetical protein PILCRDRAFT_809966 [Piloderma croceum F 1598]|uniref:DNA repair and recombination protein RAD54B n=1 Tax=Piloderma croceum (strain F 1598) TaxID=765440 RepID=A0A0C3GK19_PILCF|nr:hypothetical protein PILCRDRAFT_809966 [Piloderma croceum F 1598]